MRLKTDNSLPINLNPMKKVIIITFAVTLSIVSYGQSQKEAGIAFSNLNSFGVFYRVGSPKSLWRFSVLNVTQNSQTQSSSTQEITTSGSSFSIRIGNEFRKPMTDQLNFRIGGDLMFNYSTTTSDRNDKTTANFDTYSKTTSSGPGLNLVLGLNYKIKSILIGAEILPYFRYSKGKSTDRNNGTETTSDVSGTSYGFTSGSALLSVAYQF